MNGLAPLLGVALLGACALEPTRPNVLLITLDTTRADRLSPYGYAAAETPTYDALAQEGIVFERATSTCPLTIPSHSSIFTGLMPPQHGVRDNGDFILGAEALTLAERLKGAGWSTMAITSAFPTQRRWGFDQGFDHYHDPLTRLPDQLDWRDQRVATEVVDDTLSTLSSLTGPVFAWVHLFDAHWPYEAPEPYASRHPGSPYDAEIAYTAAEVGRLIAAWDARPGPSLVVITADHGEGLGDGGEQTHGFLLHDGTLHVPLILRARGFDPGWAPGSRSADLVSHIDIVPTLIRLLGLPADPTLPGRDLREGGSEVAWSEALTGQFNLGLAPLRSITLDEGRYTRGGHGDFYPYEGPAAGVSTEPLAVDITTTAALFDATEASFIVKEADGVALDADSLAALEALGYIGGDPKAPAGDIDPRDVIDLIPLTWQAREAIGRRRLPVAERVISTLEGRLPGAWGVELLRAQLSRAQGRPAEALGLLIALYHESPSSTIALQVAELSLQSGDAQGAEDWFEHALEHQPASAEAMAGLVRCAILNGDGPRARELADRFLWIYPDHVHIAMARAELLLEEGDLAGALAEARGAVDRAPNLPATWLVWAHVLWETGDAEASIVALIEARDIDPYEISVRMRLAECLLDVGRAAEARSNLRAARDLLAEPDPLIEAALTEAEAALAEQRGGRTAESPSR